MRMISFVLTGPPTADIGSFVKVVDDDDNPVAVGWWQHDGQNWRYIMPVELVPRLSAAVEAQVRAAQAGGDLEEPWIVEPSGAQIVPQPQRSNPALDQRRALKERLQGAKRRDATMPTATADPATIPAHWEACPSCHQKFDPALHELMSCGNCGEDKCTAYCLPDPTKPCVDCDALKGDKDEQVFDPSATPPSVFQAGFSAATVQAAVAKGEGETEDTDDEG